MRLFVHRSKTILKNQRFIRIVTRIILIQLFQIGSEIVITLRPQKETCPVADYSPGYTNIIAQFGMRNLEALSSLEQPARSAAPFQRQAPVIDEEKAAAVLNKGLGEAEKAVDDKETLGQLLKKLKEKMKSLPMVGTVLSNVPTMFRLVSSYYKGEYTNISRGNLIFIISALSYLISPFDLIPDLIPVVGLLDDMAVISLCVKQTRPALEEYLKWREMRNAAEPESSDQSL